MNVGGTPADRTVQLLVLAQCISSSVETACPQAMTTCSVAAPASAAPAAPMRARPARPPRSRARHSR